MSGDAQEREWIDLVGWTSVTGVLSALPVAYVGVRDRNRGILTLPLGPRSAAGMCPRFSAAVGLVSHIWLTPLVIGHGVGRGDTLIRRFPAPLKRPCEAFILSEVLRFALNTQYKTESA
jgi:hypothetical protein